MHLFDWQQLRALTPCCICALNVDIQLPDDNELQIILTAMVALPEKVKEGTLLDKEQPESHDLQFSMETNSTAKKEATFFSRDAEY